MSGFLRRPSPGTVIASLALLVALGGTSVAAVSITIPRASVGNPQLKNNAVTSNKVRNGSLLGVDFKTGQLPAGAPGPSGSAGPAGAQGSTGPQGPPGPSDAYSKLLNGPVAIPTSFTTVASLSIPQAGKYVATAKAVIHSTAAGAVNCLLVSGSDQDPSSVTFPAGGRGFLPAAGLLGLFSEKVG